MGLKIKEQKTQCDQSWVFITEDILEVGLNFMSSLDTRQGAAPFVPRRQHLPWAHHSLGCCLRKARHWCRELFSSPLSWLWLTAKGFSFLRNSTVLLPAISSFNLILLAALEVGHMFLFTKRNQGMKQGWNLLRNQMQEITGMRKSY